MRLTCLDTTQPSYHETLLKLAEDAQRVAYSPYTTRAIGAALVGASGRVYIGANIGNNCSTLNCCAEQAAIIQAVLARDFPFKAIAVMQNTPTPCPPCGRCLQLLSEFVVDMPIFTRGGRELVSWSLAYLLPVPFKRDELAVGAAASA